MAQDGRDDKPVSLTGVLFGRPAVPWWHNRPGLLLAGLGWSSTFALLWLMVLRQVPPDGLGLVVLAFFLFVALVASVSGG